MNMPKTPIIIEKITNFLLTLQPSLYPKAALLLTIVKFMQALSYKRLRFKTCFGMRITNLFALVFLPSGGGKDLACKNLENFILNTVFDDFSEKSKAEYKKDYDKLQQMYMGKKIPKSELNKIFPIALESQNATPEGLKKIADFLNTKDFGGIFLFISELAYIFSGSKGVELLYYLLGCYDGYDNIFVQYKQDCLQKSEKMENSHLQKEIKDRPLKALNIASLYAVLNHPTENVVTETDLKQAIETVEYLSTDLEKFINYTPQKYDQYQQFFEFLKRNKNKAFAKTELVTKHYSETGFSRKILKMQ